MLTDARVEEAVGAQHDEAGIGPLNEVGQRIARCSALVDVRLLATQGSVAARGRSGTDGRFRLEAPPGRYRLEADYPAGPGRGCEAVDVVVEAGRYARADVSCDTGIR